MRLLTFRILPAQLKCNGLRHAFPVCLGSLLILFTFLLNLTARAGTKGIIVYSEHDISDPSLIEFETISWKDGYEGQITRPNGKPDKFINSWAKKIVYFDSAYYKQVDSVPKSGPMRAHVKSREVVVDSDPQEIASSDDATRIANYVAALGVVQKDFPICTAILSPISRSLRQQLDRFNRGEQKRGGQWLTVAEVAERKAKEEADAAKKAKQLKEELRVPAPLKFTFSTLSGKTYQGVSISGVDKSGFAIMHGDGVVRISFDELLPDISDLPPEVSDRVQEYRAAALQRAKEEEAAHKKAEEQKIAKAKEEQNRAVLTKASEADQKLRAEQARNHFTGEQPAQSTNIPNETATKEGQSKPVAGVEVEPAQPTSGQETKASPPVQVTRQENVAQEPQLKPGFYSSSNSTAVEFSILAPIFIIGGYISRFKRRSGWKRGMSIGIGLYFCALLAGLALEAFYFVQFDTDHTTILCFGLALGVIPPFVCCALLETGSRLFGKKTTEELQDPELAATYVDSAITKYNQGDFSGCIADCTKAICLNPNIAAAYDIRGNAKNDMGDQREAVADYNHAIELDPACAVTYYNRANTRHDLGEVAKAIADYSKAIELNPESDEFYNNRGVVYIGANEFDLAIADFTRAIELNPLYARAHVNRGSAFTQKGEEDRAIADYQKAVELDPSMAPEFNPQIEAYLELKSKTGATSPQP